MSLKSKLQTVADVFQHYPYKIKRIGNEPNLVKKGVWVVETEAGKKILKRFIVDEDRMRFYIDALQHLQNRGMKVRWPQPTKAGRLVVREDGTLFVVSNVVPGGTMNYQQIEELQVLMEGLGRFHEAGRGFMPKTHSGSADKLGNWPKTWSGHQELAQEVTRMIKGGRSLAERLIWREMDYFQQRSAQLVQELQHSGYSLWVEQFRRQGGICHQEFLGGQVIVKTGQPPFILDWSKLCIDLPARDLRKTCLKVLQKREEWSAEVLRIMCKCYQAVQPLTQDQWQVVLLDMKYPHQFYYFLQKYYHKRQRGWSDSRYGAKFKEVIKFEKEKACFFDHLNLDFPLH